MIQFDILKNSGESFWTHTRGSSEAVSQALLFMVIISTAAGISIAGGDHLTNVQDEESLNQAIISFETVDNKISAMNTLGSENEFTTAAQSGVIRSISAELHRQEPTIITIDSGSGYEIETRPMTVSNLNYQVKYDAGIIQSRTAEGVNTIRTPVDRSRLNTNMLTISSINYTDDTQFQAGDSQPLLISQRSPPETLLLSPGDTISVATEQPEGWATYFETHSRLTDVTVGSTGGGSTPEVKAQIDPSGEFILQVNFISIEPTSR